MAVLDVLFDEAPELETSDEASLARIERFIAKAADELDAEAWGTFLERGTALLAAHLLTLRQRGGEARGGLQSERVGDMSATYATSLTLTGPLDATSYGVEFQRLRRNVYPGAHSV